MVIEARNEARQDAWQRAAFVGWQNYCLQSRGEDAPPKMGLDEWLEMFGLKDLDNLDERDDEEFAQDVNDLLARFGLEF